MAESVPLVCFAPAGAGGSFFGGWAEPAAKAGFALTAVDLPGRERRFTEPLADSVPEAAQRLRPQVEELLAGAEGGVLLGHCLGAWVAYHLARLLTEGRTGPRLLLCASGSAAPGVVVGRRAADLADEEFLAAVEANTGFVHPAFQDPELRELLLPVLRADVRAAETYRPAWTGRTAFPVVTWRANADQLVSAEAAAGWQSTAGPFVGAVEYLGDHMSVARHGTDLLADLARLWHAEAVVPSALTGAREEPC